MSGIFLHQLYGNFISTIIAFVVLAFAYLVLNLIVTKKFDSQRQRRQFQRRSFYVACVVFLFFMARIWVEGFTHLLAVLGLVSAALVVTNKETIMNFVGWLIIIWRELFAEDDLIEIQGHRGYVKNIGVLYFTLAEVSDGMNGDVTGRVVRIPNGIIANNPLVNFSQISHLMEQQFSLMVSQESNIQQAISFLENSVGDILKKFYHDRPEYSLEYLRKRNKLMANRIQLNVKVRIKPKWEKPSGVELITRYYCFSKDAEKLQQQIWLTLFDTVKNQPYITLASS